MPDTSMIKTHTPTYQPFRHTLEEINHALSGEPEPTPLERWSPLQTHEEGETSLFLNPEDEWQEKLPRTLLEKFQIEYEMGMYWDCYCVYDDYVEDYDDWGDRYRSYDDYEEDYWDDSLYDPYDEWGCYMQDLMNPTEEQKEAQWEMCQLWLKAQRCFERTGNAGLLELLWKDYDLSNRALPDSRPC